MQIAGGTKRVYMGQKGLEENVDEMAGTMYVCFEKSR